uniref:WD_REPEATS_REGION domain-containing protein n=1 Tax=Mesocestoides corti TaxID=53468 RepID=A0A5K3EUC5_MESCO
MTSYIPQFVLTGPDTVSCLSLSSKLLASGFEDGSLYLWSPDELAAPVFVFSSPMVCTAISFYANDTSILYSSYDGNIALWDLRNGTKPATVWKISNDEINSIDVLSQKGCLAAADDLGNVSLVSTTTGELITTMSKHDNICSAALFRPGWENQLISVGLDCRLIVSDWQTDGRCLDLFEMSDLVDVKSYADLLSNETHLSSDLLSNGYNEMSEPCSEDCDCDGSAEGDDSSLIEDSDQESKATSQSVNKNFIRVASSFSPEEIQQFVATQVLSQGLPLNPPMIHSLVCTESGSYVIAGLESGAVEVFRGGKHIEHVESLIGHRRSVAALLPIEESHLLSGGNDCCLFLWEISTGGSSKKFVHSGKINSLAGRHLSKIYLADNSPKIQVTDLTRA